MKVKFFYVIYRTGGTDNFKWHRTLPMKRDEAIKAQEDTEKMGYKCFIAEKESSDKIGLPETYEYKK